jgi:hypothetical protein
MITRRCCLLLNRHNVHPIGIHQHPGRFLHHAPPPPATSATPTGTSSSSTASLAGKSGQMSPYQMELQNYLNKLRWYYRSQIAASRSTPLLAAAQQEPIKPSRQRRNGFMFSAVTLFIFPYLLLEDWLGHVYAMRSQQVLREARDKSTKCKVIEVKRVPTPSGR